MMQVFTKNNIFLISFLFFLMFLTRGSHFLTEFSIPDASLIVFLILGIFCPSLILFTLFFIMGSLIDFGSAAFNVSKAFYLSDGYWGLIPAYYVMFISGQLIESKNFLSKINLYLIILFGSSTLAFIISTNTYYMFSGRFGNPSLLESILQGWNYYPEYLMPNIIYGLIFYGIYKLNIKKYFLKLI
jgi:hypothetical protein